MNADDKSATAAAGPVLSEGLGAVDALRQEFEAWAYVRDFDTTHSKLEPLRYANERTQGAWQAWGHGTANWREMRDGAVRLLRQSLAALEYHREQTRPIAQSDEAIAAVRRGLGIEAPNVPLERLPQAVRS